MRCDATQHSITTVKRCWLNNVASVEIQVGALTFTVRERGVPEEIMASGERVGLLTAAYRSGTLPCLMQALTKGIEDGLAAYGDALTPRIETLRLKSPRPTLVGGGGLCEVEGCSTEAVAFVAGEYGPRCEEHIPPSVPS